MVRMDLSGLPILATNIRRGELEVRIKQAYLAMPKFPEYPRWRPVEDVHFLDPVDEVGYILKHYGWSLDDSRDRLLRRLAQALLNHLKDDHAHNKE